MPSKQLREKDSRVVFEAPGLRRMPMAKVADARLTRQLLWAEFEEKEPGKIKLIDVRKFIRLLQDSGFINVVSESGEEVGNAGAEYHAHILQAFTDASDSGQINNILDNLSRIKLVVTENRTEIRFILKRSADSAEKPKNLK